MFVASTKLLMMNHFSGQENVNFWCTFAGRLKQTLEYDIPCSVLSADLHPDKSVFVCGGEDFKMYKFDYNTGLEMGELSFLLCRVVVKALFLPPTARGMARNPPFVQDPGVSFLACGLACRPRAE